MPLSGKRFATVKRIFSKVTVHFINGVANFLPSDAISYRLRRYLYSILGASIAKSSSFAGGGYVYGGNLKVGEKCFVNRECYFDLAAPVELGNNVFVGHHVIFITSGHEVGESDCRCGTPFSRPIVVGDGAWIGAAAKIMPGVKVGRGAIVGAGSVVTKDVPENSMVVGVPARVVKTL